MTMAHGRRVFVLGLAASPVTLITSPPNAQARTIWSADEAYDALLADSARVIDVRSREEWLETGVGAGVWPISMICATGERSASLLRVLRQARYDGYVDISEGMLGSRRRAGWLATGLPVIPLDSALASMPEGLA